MKSKKQQKSDLSKLTEAIMDVQEPIAAILFGSRARGDYDQYSDYDLLVIFQDDRSMWEHRRELYQNIAETGLFTQVLTRSLRELREETDPTFLKTVLEEGKLLYARYPTNIPANAYQLKPMAIITYHLKNLTQEEKMKAAYRLYGRETNGYQYPGIIQKCGGIRLGPGSLMIPWEAIQKLTETLDNFQIHYHSKKVFLPSQPPETSIFTNIRQKKQSQSQL